MASRSARSEPFDVQLKLLLIGDSGVGKTCLLLRFVDDKFSSSFITTIGIDFKIKNVKVGDKKVKLQIWDTAGQERFRNITTSYFRGAQAIGLVYDVTDRESFDNISRWTDQIKQHGDPGVSKILIGNKCDMTDKVQVSEAEGRALAEKYGIPFFLASAKLNTNVTEAFTAIAEEVVKKEERGGGFGRPHPGGREKKLDIKGGGGGSDDKKKGCCVIM